MGKCQLAVVPVLMAKSSLATAKFVAKSLLGACLARAEGDGCRHVEYEPDLKDTTNVKPDHQRTFDYGDVFGIVEHTYTAQKSKTSAAKCPSCHAGFGITLARVTGSKSGQYKEGGLVAVIRVSNLKDFRVSADDILGAGRRDNIPTIVTDGVSVPVHGLSISFSEITITAADVDQVVTDFKTHLGVEWESFLPDERISPIVDPATEQRVMIGPLPAHAVLGLVTAGLRAQGEDLVIHRKRKRQGVKVVAYYDAVCNYKTVPVEKDVPLGELREGDSEAVDVTGDGAGVHGHGYDSTKVTRSGRRKGQTKAWKQRDNRAIAAAKKRKSVKLTRMQAAGDLVRASRARARAVLHARAGAVPAQKGKRKRGGESGQVQKSDPPLPVGGDADADDEAEEILDADEAVVSDDDGEDDDAPPVDVSEEADDPSALDPAQPRSHHGSEDKAGDGDPFVYEGDSEKDSDHPAAPVPALDSAGFVRRIVGRKSCGAAYKLKVHKLPGEGPVYEYTIGITLPDSSSHIENHLVDRVAAASKIDRRSSTLLTNLFREMLHTSSTPRRAKKDAEKKGARILSAICAAGGPVEDAFTDPSHEEEDNVSEPEVPVVVATTANTHGGPQLVQTAPQDASPPVAVHPIFRFDDITVPDLPLSDSGSGEASSGDDAADEPTRDDEKSVDDIDEPAAGDATSPGSRFAPKISEKTFRSVTRAHKMGVNRVRLGPPGEDNLQQSFSDLKETMRREFGRTSAFECAIVVSTRPEDGKARESTYPLVPVAVIVIVSHLEMFTHKSGCWGLDSTHKLEANGYQLYTILFVSDNRSGIPLGFFFAPFDHDEYHIFAAFRWAERTLLKRGVRWVVNLFMADDDNKEKNGITRWKRGCLVRLCTKHVFDNVCDTVRPTIGTAKAAKLENALSSMTRLRSLVLDDEDWLVFEDLVTQVVELLPPAEGQYARDTRLRLPNLLHALREWKVDGPPDNWHELSVPTTRFDSNATVGKKVKAAGQVLPFVVYRLFLRHRAIRLFPCMFNYLLGMLFRTNNWLENWHRILKYFAMPLETSGIPLHKLSLAAAFVGVSQAVQSSLAQHMDSMASATILSTAQRVLDLASKRGYNAAFLLFLKQCIVTLPLGPTLVKLWRAEFFPTCAYTKSTGESIPWKDSSMVAEVASGRRERYGGSFLVTVGKVSYEVDIFSECVSCTCITFGGGDICRHIFACVRTIFTRHFVQTPNGPEVPSLTHDQITGAFVHALRGTKWFLTREALPITRVAVPLTVTAAAAGTAADMQAPVSKRPATRR